MQPKSAPNVPDEALSAGVKAVREAGASGGFSGLTLFGEGKVFLDAVRPILLSQHNAEIRERMEAKLKTSFAKATRLNERREYGLAGAEEGFVQGLQFALFILSERCETCDDTGEIGEEIGGRGERWEPCPDCKIGRVLTASPSQPPEDREGER